MPEEGCFPDWLRKRNRGDVGPSISDIDEAPPVRQLSKPYDHPDNSRKGKYNIAIQPLKFRLGGVHFQRAIQVIPPGYFDRVVITAVQDSPLLAPANDFLLAFHWGLVNGEEGVFTPILVGAGPRVDNAQFQIAKLGWKVVSHGVTALGADIIDEDVPRTNSPFVTWLVTTEGIVQNAQATNFVVTLMSKNL